MTTAYLVELYVSRHDLASVGRGVDRARQAAAELAREGTAVRYVRSIFVPDDETCLLLYEAESIAAVDAAARRAGLVFDRITTAEAAEA